MTNRFNWQRQQFLLRRRGSHGAASSVRRLDPSGYQPEPAHTSSRPLPQQSKTIALLDEADRLLLADARRRHGERSARRDRNRLVMGRYR
jgi:hypothetical protein